VRRSSVVVIDSSISDFRARDETADDM
jgi:hypothetical protein